MGPLAARSREVRAGRARRSRTRGWRLAPDSAANDPALGGHPCLRRKKSRLRPQAAGAHCLGRGPWRCAAGLNWVARDPLPSPPYPACGSGASELRAEGGGGGGMPGGGSRSRGGEEVQGAWEVQCGPPQGLRTGVPHPPSWGGAQTLREDCQRSPDKGKKPKRRPRGWCLKPGMRTHSVGSGRKAEEVTRKAERMVAGVGRRRRRATRTN